MFGLDSGCRYFVCGHTVNMRKGIDSLFNLIRSESSLSPLNGDVYVFFSHNFQSVKLLRWDTDGFVLYHKRLERGSFEMPPRKMSLPGITSSRGRLFFLMSGVSLTSVRFRKRFWMRYSST